MDLDIAILPGIDVCADLECCLPFADSVFDEIEGVHVLEHIENLTGLLHELTRVGRPGAKILLEVPHFSSPGAYTDPTHRHFFGYYSFDYFVGLGPYSFYEPTLDLDLQSRRIQIYWIKNEKRELPARIPTFLVNRFPRFYERFLCWIFPANEVQFVLEIPDRTEQHDQTPREPSVASSRVASKPRLSRK